MRLLFTRFRVMLRNKKPKRVIVQRITLKWRPFSRKNCLFLFQIKPCRQVEYITVHIKPESLCI